MKKLLIIAIMIFSFSPYVYAASDYDYGPLADGYLYTTSNGAYGETIAIDTMDYISVVVTVEYMDGFTSRRATESGSRTNYDYANAGVIVSGTPIKATGSHYYEHVPTNSFWSGSTSVQY